MARKRNEEYIDPAIPPYLTYDEQAFVAMYLLTDGNLSKIARQWPHRVTAGDCERLAADQRIKAECEYLMKMQDEVLQGKKVEQRLGHNPFLEIEHIANAYSRAANLKTAPIDAADSPLRRKHHRGGRPLKESA